MDSKTKQTFPVAILFLIFNRPDTTRTVFERIREIRPERLYVAADAPRSNKKGEAEKCLETKEVIKNIDWPCEIKTLYRTENLGCKLAVSGAISWFFEQEPYGIILEDDCLPDLSFFPFCRELLEKYKDDDRVGHIGGNCFLPGIITPPLSYDFCSITLIWGWATWRRVWQKVDINLPYWKQFPELRKNLFRNKAEEIYFTSFIEDALNKKNGMDPWAVFYYFGLRSQNQLSIYPAVNLVSNIGLNSPDATHTLKNNSKFHIGTDPLELPVVHPLYMVDNQLINKRSVRFHFFSWKRLIRYYFPF